MNHMKNSQAFQNKLQGWQSGQDDNQAMSRWLNSHNPHFRPRGPENPCKY